MSLAARLWDRTRDYAALGGLVLLSLLVLFGQNNAALRAARASALDLTARVETLFAGVGRFAQALTENERLRAESIDLAAEVALLRQERAENERLRLLLGFRDSTDWQMLPARVVRRDVTRQTNLLTIDRGTADGVAVDMAVIDERGIVGKVLLAGDDFAVVLPHQNTAFAVPARIDAIGRDGLARWDGQAYDRLSLDYIVRTDSVTKGMLVTTSPYSEVFPPGIPVGTVDSVLVAKGRNDYILYVKPAVPIGAVDFVYVLLSRPPAASAVIDSLETAARDEGLGR